MAYTISRPGTYRTIAHAPSIASTQRAHLTTIRQLCLTYASDVEIFAATCGALADATDLSAVVHLLPRTVRGQVSHLLSSQSGYSL